MVSPIEAEIQPIWNRIKARIDVTKIKSRTPQGIESEIEAALKSATEPRIQNLLKSDFAIKAAQNREIRKDISQILEKKKVKRKPAVPPNVKQTDGKTIIKTRKKTKTFKTENLSIVYSLYRGEPAFYITNRRTKKRVTWGLLEWMFWKKKKF